MLAFGHLALLAGAQKIDLLIQIQSQHLSPQLIVVAQPA
jgi:hypothetical protein